MQELVGDDRQRAPFAQPGRLVDHLLGQRLLDEQRIALGEPADRFERPLLIGPSLIGVDTERLVGRRADDLDELAVALDAHFDLDHVVGNRFLDFLPDDLGRVDADRERGVGRLFGRQTPYLVPRLSEQLADQIVQRQIDRSLGRPVVGSSPVDVVENLVHAERVRELAQVERAQKAADRLLRLAQIGRHRCLAVARYAVVFERDLYVGRVRAGVDRDRERMDQLQIVGFEGEAQPAAVTLGPLVRRTGDGA